MIKKLAIGLLIAVYSCWPSNAYACDTEASANEGSTCVVTVWRAKRGVWFDLQVAEELRYRWATQPLYTQGLQTADSIIELQRDQIALQARIIGLRAREADELRGQIADDSTTIERVVAKTESSHWPRTIALVGGLVLGVVLGWSAHEVIK